MVDETQPPTPTPPPTPPPTSPGPADAFLESAHANAGSQGKRPPLRGRYLAVAGAAVVAISVVAIVVATVGGPTRLRQAHDDCGLGSAVGVQLDDDDTTLVFDTMGDDDLLGASITDVACALNALDIPSRVINLIDSTRALDGRQTDSWDGLTATWSYHPDTGLDLMVTED